MTITLNKAELDKELVAFANLIRRRLRQDWDIVIAITGEEGCGKSTLGILLGALIDSYFDLEKNVSFLPNAEEITKEFTSLKKYQCYVIDEAIRALYKMNFMSTLQQTLVQMWATERYQNKATIMILPRFRDLTENFRNHRVKLWIHVVARGRAIVYIRDDDPHNLDPWLFDYMQKYKEKAFGRRNIATIDVNRRIKTERRLRNYLFDFEFPDLDPVDKNTYAYHKHQSRLKYLDEEKERQMTSGGKLATQYKASRDWLIWYIMRLCNIESRKKTKEFLCEKLSISTASFKEILKHGDTEEKEKNDREERMNTYIGVDRFLEQALELEKQKHENEYTKPKDDWSNIDV